MIKLHLQATLAFSFKLILKLQLRRTTRRRGGRGYFQGNREISGISRKIKESRKFMDIKEYYVREILKYQGNQEKYLGNQEKYQEKKENYQGNQEKYQKIKKYLGNQGKYLGVERNIKEIKRNIKEIKKYQGKQEISEKSRNFREIMEYQRNQ